MVVELRVGKVLDDSKGCSEYFHFYHSEGHILH